MSHDVDGRGPTLLVEGLIMTGPRTAELQTQAVPLPPNPVIVEVELCGVCTPEQRAFRGAAPAYPYWGGHELSAIVAEDQSAGPAGSLTPGARVVVGLMPRCGVCEACRRGLDNHCAYLHRQAPAPGSPVGPRGFSRRLALPREMVFPFSAPAPPPRTAALAEPVACCLRSLRAGGARPGDAVAVYGAGTMGRIHAALLMARGCRVLIFDRDPDALAAAQSLQPCFVGPDDAQTVRDAVMEASGGFGCAAAFCTRGGGEAISTAVRMSARGGTVVLYQSMPNSLAIPLDANDLHYREVRLVGVVAQSAGDLRESVALLSRWPNFADLLAHETFTAGHGAAALERALNPAVNRVFIDFRDGPPA